MRARSTWMPLLVVACVLTGCSATAAPSASVTASPSPSPSASAPCLVGEWSAGAAQLQPLYDAIPGSLDYPTATIDPAASVMISFDESGDFHFEQDAAVSLTWEGHPAAVVLNGALDGTYVADAPAMTLTAGANTLSVRPADERPASMLFALATQETLTEWPVAAHAFACDGDALALQLETEGHSVELGLVRINIS